ncbi:hypothetical protein LENED_008943 [Lentinula edodes]|uniref:Uncharacterized protein n=1 Tax=Lentinula edodes TaxID=5353 RepID=A0A1Q3EIL9_LENED|nr:hypothetical protein LENED_008943 [Lentinula edodes]
MLGDFFAFNLYIRPKLPDESSRYCRNFALCTETLRVNESQKQGGFPPYQGTARCPTNALFLDLFQGFCRFD